MRRTLALLLPAALLGCATYDTQLGVEKDGDTAAAPDDCAEQLWFADGDGDGWGGPTSLSSCGAPAAAGWVLQPGDCDDADAAVSPDGVELCNGIDDDCDGQVDAGATDPGTWYADTDADGFGDPEVPLSACSQPDGSAPDPTDCDDADAAVSPDGVEVCNGVDDDCNGEVDDAPADPSWFYADADGDGHGDPDDRVEACTAPSGYVSLDDDCDDADAGTWESCDDPTSGTGTCSGALSSYDSGVGTSPELHIVGVYEPNPRGTSITVNVDRAAPVKLVLSSYEPTTWIVNPAAGTTITDIVVNGYNSSTVSGGGGATVTHRTGGGTYWSACAYGWPSTTGGCDTPGLVAAAETWAGVATRSFVGCYAGSAFDIR